MRILILFLLIWVHSCNQPIGEKKLLINPKARQLNDSAALILMHSDNCEKALALLEQAISIDSNYLIAYSNKLSCELQLKRYPNALITATSMNRIKPDVPEYLVSLGIVHEKTGDTVSAKYCYSRAEVIYNRILDTLKSTDLRHGIMLLNKAFNLILLGEEKKGNDLLKQIYDSEKDAEIKELLSIYLNRTRREVMDELFQEAIHGIDF